MDKIVIGVLVVMVVLVVACHWRKRHQVKAKITGLTVSEGVVALTTAPLGKGKKAPAVGKKISIVTKSLGKIRTTVASAVAGGEGLSISTAANAYTGAATYAPDASDHVVY